MKKVIEFLKKEIVMTVSLVLALASMLLVPPDAGYGTYIDWDVLMLLFALMAVVAGFKKCRVFDAVSAWLVKMGGNLRHLLAKEGMGGNHALPRRVSRARKISMSSGVVSLMFFSEPWLK